MGLFDKLTKTLGTVERVTSTTDRTINTAERVSNTAKRVGDALAKKCKYCNMPLKTDKEKEKGICSNCALERMK